jgi:hypothetical protein
MLSGQIGSILLFINFVTNDAYSVPYNQETSELCKKFLRATRLKLNESLKFRAAADSKAGQPRRTSPQKDYPRQVPAGSRPFVKCHPREKALRYSQVCGTIQRRDK